MATQVTCRPHWRRLGNNEAEPETRGGDRLAHVDGTIRTVLPGDFGVRRTQFGYRACGQHGGVASAMP